MWESCGICISTDVFCGIIPFPSGAGKRGRILPLLPSAFSSVTGANYQRNATHECCILIQDAWFFFHICASLSKYLNIMAPLCLRNQSIGWIILVISNMGRYEKQIQVEIVFNVTNSANLCWFPSPAILCFFSTVKFDFQSALVSFWLDWFCSGWLPLRPSLARSTIDMTVPWNSCQPMTEGSWWTNIAGLCTSTGGTIGNTE